MYGICLKKFLSFFSYCFLNFFSLVLTKVFSSSNKRCVASSFAFCSSSLRQHGSWSGFCDPFTRTLQNAIIKVHSHKQFCKRFAGQTHTHTHRVVGSYSLLISFPPSLFVSTSASIPVRSRCFCQLHHLQLCYCSLTILVGFFSFFHLFLFLLLLLFLYLQIRLSYFIPLFLNNRAKLSFQSGRCWYPIFRDHIFFRSFGLKNSFDEQVFSSPKEIVS